MKLTELLDQGVCMLRKHKEFIQLWILGFNNGESQDGLGHRGE